MNASYVFDGALGIVPRIITLVVALGSYAMIFGAGILLYAIQSFGMYTIAKRRGVKKTWLAWIPVGNMFLLGSLSDQYQYVSKGRIRNRRKVILGLSVAVAVLAVAAVVCYVLMIINTVGGAFGTAFDHRGMLTPLVSALSAIGIMELANLALTVFRYICLYDLYRSCEPKNSVAYLVLSIVFPVSMPVFVFLCRSDDKGMPPRRTVPEE